MVDSDIRVGAALVDAPQHLLGIHRILQGVEPGVLCLAPHQPTVSPVHTLLHIGSGSRIFDALVKGHADVRAQVGLNLHTLLRAHKNLVSVDMGGEGHPFLLDFPQRGQGKHLKSAGVREDGAVPGHKLMEAPALLHNLIGGAQVQVVGIGKLHLAADVLQVLGAQGSFDGPLGTHIHKHRGLHCAVGTGKLTPPGSPFGFFQFKHRLPRKRFNTKTWHPRRRRNGISP